MMKSLITTIVIFFLMQTKAQIPPILDYVWTIEHIDTGSQIITADLNPFGDYDTFEPVFVGNFDNLDFYFLTFGHCEGDLTFINNGFQFYYHFSGCLLSNDDSSQIALYFNYNFIQQNTNQTTIDNDVSPNVYGPLNYSFTTIGNIIYLDITNSIGEVATFSANNLSAKEFLEQAISIYPNPVSDILNIDHKLVSIEKVILYDIHGRQLKEFSGLNNNVIDMAELSQGFYFLHIETSVGVLSKKVVKQ